MQPGCSTFVARTSIATKLTGKRSRIESGRLRGTNRVSKCAAITDGSTQLAASSDFDFTSRLSASSPQFRRISERQSREDSATKVRKVASDLTDKNVERMQIQRRRNGVCQCRLSEQQRAATAKRHPHRCQGCFAGFARLALLLFNVHVSNNLQTRCVLRPSANRLDRVRHRC